MKADNPHDQCVIINIIPSIKCPRGFNLREKNILKDIFLALNG